MSVCARRPGSRRSLTPVAASKAELRQRLRARRDAIEPLDAAAAAACIAGHLSPFLRDRRVIAGFAATRGEVDLSEFYSERMASGSAVCFPRVAGPGELEFALVSDLAELREGAFGILEPSGEPIALAAIEVFLVPGLGFDRQGTRLGFGGGYYDRALRKRTSLGDIVPLFMGIGYSCQVLDTNLPVDEWDVPVDSIVTESGILQIVRARGG